ncbi:MAG TPA: ATP-binding protein [Anaeromyxobacteraceae bacterium]|nr:ATP-binding protein [Anaeromyxobacteraceae bacterium]
MANSDDGAPGRDAGPRDATPTSTEERYKLVVECVRDYAIFMLDRSGHISTWNPGAERIKGWTASEIIGKHFSIFYPPEDVASGKPDYELIEAAKIGRFEDEGWRLRKDRSPFWANVVITALRDGSGNLVGFAKVTRDLTERRRAEEVRLQLGRAEEAVKVRDQFLMALSHELRNPLAPIRSAVQTIRRSPPASAASFRGLDVIDRQVTLLAGIIDDLIAVSRLTRGTIDLEYELIDLGALVAAVVEDHRGVLQDVGVALEIAAPEEPLWVQGDAKRLAQAVGNLLQNARKFTPRGGRVLVAAERSDGCARIRVRDDGVGMEPGLLARLFQPFVQADRTLARSSGGLGLGLALVKGFVELHGGKVAARSDGPGRGSEFVIDLPIASGVAASPSRRASGAHRRVLVVDDNADAAESLADLLRVLGHDVTVAFDGASAVELAQRQVPDVVLCDIGLPQMDGYEVGRALRRDRRLAKALLVAVSGYASEDDVKRALAAGFDRHIAKPPDPIEIERLVG